MATLEVYTDAYADYWHTIEADLDDPAPIAIYDLDEPFSEDTPQDVIDAYTEFSTMSED